MGKQRPTNTPTPSPAAHRPSRPILRLAERGRRLGRSPTPRLPPPTPRVLPASLRPAPQWGRQSPSGRLDLPPPLPSSAEEARFPGGQRHKASSRDWEELSLPWTLVH